MFGLVSHYIFILLFSVLNLQPNTLCQAVPYQMNHAWVLFCGLSIRYVPLPSLVNKTERMVLDFFKESITDNYGSLMAASSL